MLPAKGIAAVLAIAAGLYAQTKPAWVPTFADEFDGKELDLGKWAPHDPWGRARPREVQAYAVDAITVKDGAAHIAARHEHAMYDGHEREYTSGMMTTYGSFAQMYGRFEIRCRIPSGRGLEPKFYLLPVPSAEIPSIDVLDAAGSDPSKALFGNLWGTETTERSYRGSYTVGDLSADFHVLAIEWDKDKIVWFVDGKERFRSVDGIPHQPMYLAVSLVVGGAVAGFPEETTKFPATFDIDYIRVYQLKN